MMTSDIAPVLYTCSMIGLGAQQARRQDRSQPERETHEQADALEERQEALHQLAQDRDHANTCPPSNCS